MQKYKKVEKTHSFLYLISILYYFCAKFENSKNYVLDT